MFHVKHLDRPPSPVSDASRFRCSGFRPLAVCGVDLSVGSILKLGGLDLNMRPALGPRLADRTRLPHTDNHGCRKKSGSRLRPLSNGELSGAYLIPISHLPSPTSLIPSSSVVITQKKRPACHHNRVLEIGLVCSCQSKRSGALGGPTIGLVFVAFDVAKQCGHRRRGHARDARCSTDGFRLNFFQLQADLS